MRPDVIKYADYVYLTAIEYARMSDKYTKEVVDKAIELLSLWKSTEENKNKCHMDDNLTIQKWAIKEAMKNITEEKRLAKAQGTLPFNKPTGKTLNQLMEEQDALAKTV